MNRKWKAASAGKGNVSSLPRREELDRRYQWNLADIYPSIDGWRSDFHRLEKLTNEMTAFEGTLGGSAENLLACLRKSDEMGKVFDSLYVYAHLLRDQDSGNPQSQALADKITILQTRVSQAESFVNPEILALPEGKIAKFLEENADLRLYAHYLDNLNRKREHTLSPKEEKLLAMAANMAAGPRSIFNMLNNADIRFPTIRDEEGNEVEVTKGRYSRFMESSDRRVRKDAYGALLGTYRKYANTLAATLSASVSRDIFFARARGYGSCLTASLDARNIPVEVYDNVVDVVGAHLKPLHEYIALRKKLLGYDVLKPYDLFVPLFPEVKEKVEYETAVDTVVEGLAPMGDEYVALLRKGFTSGWIDVFENEGKRSGAYSWGSFGNHPYVLLNFQGRLDDMFTIAHEMGHALHTYHTTAAQPYVYADYSIFAAEVASTTNEALLVDHLLKKTGDRKKKLYLLNHHLDQIRSTVYTQVLFAEFEKIIHDRVERGDPLTAERMGTIFRELFHKYNGAAVAEEPETAIYWARVPHFYNSFYVYQYATGYSAATMLSQKILAGEKNALPKYIRFLKSGSSRYPIDLLTDAGVDMTSPEPVEATCALFSRLLAELKDLLRNGGEPGESA